jgi:hypothetical protein
MALCFQNRVICVLYNGEMLGETRLVMEEAVLKHGPAPTRNATLVASGDSVLLVISTAMARECFKGDVLKELRGLRQQRQRMLQTSSPEWLTVEINSKHSLQAPEEAETLQVCAPKYKHTTCSARFWYCTAPWQIPQGGSFPPPVF